MGSGTMRQIRTLLSQGKSSGEGVAMGFKPGSVRKEAHAMRHAHNGATSQVLNGRAKPAVAANSSVRPLVVHHPDGALAEVEQDPEIVEMVLLVIGGWHVIGCLPVSDPSLQVPPCWSAEAMATTYLIVDAKRLERVQYPPDGQGIAHACDYT